jgi:thioester reductase-like protein
VLHSAAQVHHLKPYHLLKQTNVDATLEILKLCTTSRHVIPLHYVSAIGIFIADLNTSASFTEADLPESLSELKNGYFKSKWISERILQRIYKRGFACNIYRPGLLFSKNSMITLAGDFIWRVFKTSLIMGYYPDSGMNLLLAPVDAVSCAIVESIRSNRAGDVYHLFETQVRFRDLSIAAVDLGYRLEPVNAEKWHSLSLDLYEKSPDAHPLADYLNAYDIKIIKMMTLMGEQPISVSCTKTQTLLSAMGLSRISVTGDVLKVCIRALQNAKIIPLPRETLISPRMQKHTNI